MTSECIFCDATSETLVYRGDDGFVVVDDPVRPGHVLVGAPCHSESLHELSEEDAANTLGLANKVSKMIVAIGGAQKVYVAAIGDKVKHFHIHLLPKRAEDPSLGPFLFGPQGWVSSLSVEVDRTAMAVMAETLRGYLGANH